MQMQRMHTQPLSLPPLGKSDHNLIHLQPQYTLLVQRQPATRRSIRRMVIWSRRSPECFDTTDWSVVQSLHGEDIDGLTHCLTDYLNFCMDVVAPAKTVRRYPNNEPRGNACSQSGTKQEEGGIEKSGQGSHEGSSEEEVKACLKEVKEGSGRRIEEKLA